MQESKGDNKQGGLSWSTPAQNPMPVQKMSAVPKVQVMPAPASSSAKYITMVVLGIIAGVIIAWGWSALRSPKESASTSPATSTAASAYTDTGIDTSAVPALGSASGLVIASPQIAGNSVAVAAAAVSSPTWIVVYENNSGKPGNALGAALFFPESKSGTVELLRATTAGKSYLAAKQVDNGDRKFSLKDDQFLTENGEVQWISFEVK